MKLLFVSAEVAPFSKSGGLGDVCQALPLALSRMGHEVVTVSPCYQGAQVASLEWEERASFVYWLFGHEHEVRFMVAQESPTLHHVLLANPCFERGGLYGDQEGMFGDNLMRFALLSRACLDVPRRVPLSAGALWGEVDVLHAHDWQAALAPVYLQAIHKPMGLSPKTRSVFTVHNAAHQGIFPGAQFGGLDLSLRHRDTLFHGSEINLMRAGLLAADHTTAVSPSFARELQSAEGGFGLDEVFSSLASQGRLHGFLNGIDTQGWDPATDPVLEAGFSVQSIQGKAECKRALQGALGLPQRDDVPLLGVISRLDWQKGVDLILEASPSILAQEVQLVSLGTGDPALEQGLRMLQAFHPEKARSIINFDAVLARQIYAAADIFLVPSLFEPCGLTQMYAMRYGAVPVVRSTGGLIDSVQPWDPHTRQGTGWRFQEHTPEALATATGWAVHTWQHYAEDWSVLRAQAMQRQFGWEHAAQAYVDLYQRAC